MLRVCLRNGAIARTPEHAQARADDGAVRSRLVMDAAVEGVEERALLKKRQECDEDASLMAPLEGAPPWGGGQLEGPRGHHPVPMVLLVRGESELFEFVGALCPGGGLGGGLNRR